MKNRRKPDTTARKNLGFLGTVLKFFTFVSFLGFLMLFKNLTTLFFAAVFQPVQISEESPLVAYDV